MPYSAMGARLKGLRARSALAITGLLAASWIAAAPLDVVRECAATASAGLSGIKDLTAACPQLPEALDALGLTEFLYDGWREQLNVHGLRDLWELVNRYAEPRWKAAPDVAAMAEILKELKREQAPQSESWWSSFKIWLKNWLSHSDSSVVQWLNRRLGGWLASAEASPTLLKVISYCSTALVLLAAALVILREIKAAGVLRRPPAARAARSSQTTVSSPDSAGLSAPVVQRLNELLRRLVDILVRTGRLKAERSLTHRELIVRSSFDDDSQRAAFARVAGTAESIVYGPTGAVPDQLAQALEQGERLVERLSRSSPP
jgi:hypothetical protein